MEREEEQHRNTETDIYSERQRQKLMGKRLILPREETEMLGAGQSSEIRRENDSEGPGKLREDESQGNSSSISLRETQGALTTASHWSCPPGAPAASPDRPAPWGDRLGPFPAAPQETKSWPQCNSHPRACRTG